MINGINYRSVFERAIRQGEQAIERVMAVWLWCHENRDTVDQKWLQHARNEIRRVFGLQPEAYAGLVTRYSLAGETALDGVRRLKKVGIGEAVRAAQCLPGRDLKELIAKVDSIKPEEFSAVVDAHLEKVKQAARDLGKQRKDKGDKKPDPRAECNRLRTENAMLRKRVSELEAENADLRSRFESVESILGRRTGQKSSTKR